MEYRRHIEDLVKSRYSCRGYQIGRIGALETRELKNACYALKRGLANEEVKYDFIALEADRLRSSVSDDFSYISNPRNFIIGSIRESKTGLVSFGYLMEHLVLKATDLDLGTCWLGYFNPDLFKDLICAAGEVMPAVCAVGYPAEGRVSSTRKSWRELFYFGDAYTPLSKKAAGLYESPLEMVRLGPSSGNTQPWRIVKGGDQPVFHFFKIAVERDYEAKGLHYLDLGIALCHFELTARGMNLRGEWAMINRYAGILPDSWEYIMSWRGEG